MTELWVERTGTRRYTGRSSRGAEVLIGWPDEQAERNHFELAIPEFGSIVNNAAPDEALPGLDQFAREDRPPVWITFWALQRSR